MGYAYKSGEAFRRRKQSTAFSLPLELLDEFYMTQKYDSRFKTRSDLVEKLIRDYVESRREETQKFLVVKEE